MGRTLLMLLVLAGCGGTPAAGGVASASEGTAAAASPSPSGDVLKFAQCLRDQGLQVEDPAPGERVDIADADSQGREVMEKAMTACRAFAPPSVTDHEKDPQSQDAMLAYAVCMRKEGLNWPDPVVVNGDARWPSGQNLPRNTASFKAADKKCRPLLGEKKSGGAK